MSRSTDPPWSIRRHETAHDVEYVVLRGSQCMATAITPDLANVVLNALVEHERQMNAADQATAEWVARRRLE